MTDSARFAPPGSHDTLENGTVLSPRFGPDGLVTAVVSDAGNGDVLMVAHMNAEALARTIETGEAWFWSRSRQKLWRKGEESGNRLEVDELRVDCDQDSVLLRVKVGGDGVACHLGFRSCFYRVVPVGNAVSPALALTFDETMPRVKPKAAR